MQRNILEYLERTVKKYPDKLAFANESMGMTFQEVSDVSGSIGTCLLKKGYQREPVVIYEETSSYDRRILGSGLQRLLLRSY